MVDKTVFTTKFASQYTQHNLMVMNEYVLMCGI